MSATEVTATLAKEDSPEVTVSYNFGDNLAESVELFGEDAVYSRFVAAARVDLQALIRRGISAGHDAAKIQETVDNWKPGAVNRTRKSPEDKIASILENVPEEERAKVLQDLIASMESE